MHSIAPLPPAILRLPQGDFLYVGKKALPHLPGQRFRVFTPCSRASAAAAMPRIRRSFAGYCIHAFRQLHPSYIKPSPLPPAGMIRGWPRMGGEGKK